MRYIFTWWLFALAIIGVSGCSANKYLADGEKYYEGASIEIVTDEDVPKQDINETKEDIEEVFSLDPNLKILGSRPRVWFYHLAGDVTKEKGFKHWMKFKLGEAPVVLDQHDRVRTANLVKNRLTSNGFFQSRIITEIDSGRHKASVKYTAEVIEPYRYDSIAPYEPDSIVLVRKINELQDNTILSPGQRYNFNKLQEERLRLEGALRNGGYYFFDDRYIIYEADTTIGNRKINLYPVFNDDMPAVAGEIYKIGEVNVYADYDWAVRDSLSNGDVLDTVEIENVRYIRKRDNFKPNAIVSHVKLRPGDIYNRNRELITLNRMIQLDAFHYVNLTFDEMGDHELRANLFLSPLKKKSVRVSVEAVTTSNSFVGPHLTGSFLNRNFLGGAERYELNLTTGYEWQFGGKTNQGLSNYEFGIENVLTVPHLIQPFRIRYNNARYIPETKFKLGAKAQRRVGFYQLNSINANYGFEWRETATKRHKLYPVSLNFIDLARTTPEFDSLLLNDPFLARSFEEQFIIGSSYSYYFSSQEDKSRARKRHNYYFNGNIDLSGNLMRLGQNTFNLGEKNENGSYTLLGQPYSQFVRLSIDFRHYLDFKGDNRLVSRFTTGVGYAYGNSLTLPYTMQFSVGGSSSLRAFRARSVGPGSFRPDSSITFIDQTADIKLEFNVEYRFTMLGALKGAFFVDAGNIWTLREDEQRPGGKFEWRNVLRELAVGTGFGVRYDFQFFVIRLDMGIPFFVPYEITDEEGNPDFFRWKPLNREWRKQYMIWNLAIGYPF
ncbi:BamA/TamA family outer membrane protein [Fulvivirga sedimenti]|uniref:BamA/TamA family outer membrane protein n=1 Tax=Fulvivirga sedimenti TaxID=2879465 RepID=A0A9X1KW61_9BACT|nr:BamA/TamA family outer membrane protein [Fulvivirga sedimenti]MCA6073639.1 BamA/TamA family outer membrane protein [Fulvivirga sedimenti]